MNKREPLWQRLKEAGFSKRDSRLQCGECGKLVARQFLPIHKCEMRDDPQAKAEAEELIRRVK